MFKVILALCVVSALALYTEAKIYEECELVDELRRQGFPENQLQDWICMTQQTGFNTRFVAPGGGGSRDFGIFMINDRYYCGLTSAGGECKVKCSDLLIDNIAKAGKCAKLIYKRHGFAAFNGFNTNCRSDKPLPDISKCMEARATESSNKADSSTSSTARPTSSTTASSGSTTSTARPTTTTGSSTTTTGSSTTTTGSSTTTTGSSTTTTGSSTTTTGR